MVIYLFFFFFFSSRRRHTRFSRDWSSDVCSSDLEALPLLREALAKETDPAAKATMTIAIAVADLRDTDSAKRLAAAGILGEATDLRVRSVLQASVGAETDPKVKAALTAA